MFCLGHFCKDKSNNNTKKFREISTKRSAELKARQSQNLQRLLCLLCFLQRNISQRNTRSFWRLRRSSVSDEKASMPTAKSAKCSSILISKNKRKKGIGLALGNSKHECNQTRKHKISAECSHTEHASGSGAACVARYSINTYTVGGPTPPVLRGKGDHSAAASPPAACQTPCTK